MAWRPPFVWTEQDRRQLPASYVARILRNTHPFFLGKAALSRCRTNVGVADVAADADAHADADADDVVCNEEDFWQRDVVVRPGGGRDLMFVNSADTTDIWRKAFASAFEPSSSMAPAPDSSSSKKKRLDRLLQTLYSRRMSSEEATRSGALSRASRAFADRAVPALKAYCRMRGWTYGYDALLLDTGVAASEGFHPHVRAKLRETGCSSAAACLSYDVFLRLSSSSNEVTKDSEDSEDSEDDRRTISDVQQLMLHVLYAVDHELRTNGGEPCWWRLPDDVLSLAPEDFRRIEPRIADVRPVARNKDSGMWTVRDEHRTHVIIKPVDALVWSNSRRNDESTVQGWRRSRLCGELHCPLFVSASWPSLHRVKGEGEGATTRTHGGDTLLRLRHDVQVTANLDSSDGSCSSSTTSKTVRCPVDLLSVRIRGKLDPWRDAFLTAASSTPPGYFYVPTDASCSYLTSPPAPSVYCCWGFEMTSFFRWLEDPVTPVEPEAARLRAWRLLWTCCALDVQMREQQRCTVDATNDNDDGNGNGNGTPTAATTTESPFDGTLQALQACKMALAQESDDDTNETNSATHTFSFPFDCLLYNYASWVALAAASSSVRPHLQDLVRWLRQLLHHLVCRTIEELGRPSV